MFRNWWRGVTKRPSYSPRGRKRPSRRPRLHLEQLEDRTLLTVQPLTLVDPSLWTTTSGLQPSGFPSISADGQLVAFGSKADNLVPNDNNGLPDAFVYNRSTGVVTLVSVGPNGVAAGIGANHGSPDVVLSPDGRYVVFESNSPTATILPGVTGDQLYLRDLAAGATTLLSVGVGGSAGDHESLMPVFSADGHDVVFASDADNLVPGMTATGTPEVNLFERDLLTGTTALVSTYGTSISDFYSGGVSVSADGRYVAYQSRIVDTQANDPAAKNSFNVVVRDMDTGTITLASVNTAGTGGAGADALLSPGGHSLSADGRYVVFDSTATNLVPGSPSGRNVYLRDLVSGATTLLSTAPNGAAAGGSSGEVISADGRHVAFMSSQALMSQDTNGHNDVYVYDTAGHTLALVSINTAGTNGGNGDSGFTAGGGSSVTFTATEQQNGGLIFSADGGSLVFESSATNLTAGVATSQGNLYERNLAAGTTTLLTPDTAGSDGGNGAVLSPAAVSANGQVVAFGSTASNLVANDQGGKEDVFVRDAKAGTTALASARSPLLPAAYPTEIDTGSSLGSVSANGRYVAFTSGVPATSSDLAPGVTFKGEFSPSHVFVRDRQTGAIQVVDLNASGVAVGGLDPVISPDGRHVVFVGGTDLLPAGIVFSDVHDNIVYVRDLQTGTTTPVSVTPDGTHDISVVGDIEVALADTGSDLFVAFTTNANSTIPGVTNPSGDTAVFLHDVQAGTTVFVSHDTANDGQVRGNSQHISISGDGRYVLFSSTDPNLTTNDTTNFWQVYRWDRTTGQNSLVSINFAHTGPANQSSAAADPPVMSSDGRYIAFDSSAKNLYSGNDPINPPPESVYLVDMATGTITNLGLTSSAKDSGVSYAPAISADGSTVAFNSDARLDASLVYNPPIENQYFATSNVYVAGPAGTHVVSVNDIPPGQPGYGTGNAGSAGFGSNGFAGFEAPLLSADGRYVAFSSTATNLVPGFVDGNNSAQSDIYVRDLQTGLTKLVTYNQSGTASGNGQEAGAGLHDLISGDGSTLFFDSPAPDLFIGDRNGQRDVLAASSAGFSSISGEVFNDLNANAALDTGEPGLPYWTVYLDTNNNGKLDPGEPSVTTDTSGHYSLTGVAPGTYTVAAVPQTGYMQTTPLTYTVTISTDGTAVTGKNFGEELPLPDLVASNVTFTPASGAPGQAVTVNWTVKDQGNAAAVGSWADAVYLSPTPALGRGAQLLTTVPHSNGLGVNGQYTGSASVALPPTLGSDYVIVQADWRNQVNEGVFGANKANDTAASSSALTVAAPTLTVGQPVSDPFTATEPDRYFQISLTAGKALLLTLGGSPANDSNRILVRFGALPTTYQYDFGTPPTSGANPGLPVPVTQTGTYYILIHNQSGDPGSFTLTATQPGLAVLQASPAAVGNAGLATVAISGTDFQPMTTFTLTGPGGNLSATAVQFANATLAYVTFDLTGVATGAYTVRAADSDGTTTTLANALQVQTGAGGQIETRLIAPDLVRVGQVQQLFVEYQNVGDADAPAPILFVSSPTTNTPMGLSPTDLFNGRNLSFLGVSQDGPPGVLRPGSRYQVPVYFQVLDGNSPATGSSNSFGFNLTVFDGDNTQPIDWNVVQQWIDPTQEADLPNFPAVFAALQKMIGTTWGDFDRMAARNATLLPASEKFDNSFLSSLDLEVRLAAATVETSLRGTLTSGGAQVAVGHQTVNAVGTLYGNTYTTTSLEDGSFVFENEQPDVYQFTVNGVSVAPITPISLFDGQHATAINLQLSQGATVSGHITAQADNSPVPGAAVSAYGDDGSVAAGVVAAAGSYTISGLNPGTYTVIAEADGLARTVVSGLTVGAAGLTQDIVMAPQATLSGSVVLPGGGPTGNPLTVVAQPSGSDGGFFSFSVQATGTSFTLTGLPAGTYDVNLGELGYTSQTISGVVVGAGATVTVPPVNLVQGGTITGTITSTDPNDPAADHTVGLLDSGGDTLYTTLADADGNFSFTDVAAGTYTLSLLDYGLAASQSVTVAAGGTTSGLTVAIRLGSSITGTVKDSAGNPLPNIPVVLYAPNGSTLQLTTDPTGTYRFDRLDAGSYLVTLNESGPSTSATINVSGNDGEVNQANFTVTVAARLQGAILDGSGHPLPYATAELQQNGVVIADALADANGSYGFLITNPGTFDLLGISQAASFPLVSGITVASGQTVTQNLQAGSGSLALTLTGSAGTAYATVTLAQLQSGQRIPAGTAQTDANGNVTFSNLVGGSYLVLARGFGDYGAETTVAVSGNTTATLPLADQGHVTGQVTGTSGAVPGATVTFQSGSGLTPTTVSLTDGSFSLGNLTAGTYDVIVAAPGMQPLVEPGVSISAGAATMNFSLAGATSFLTGTTVFDDPFNGRQLVPGAELVVEDAAGHVVASGRSDQHANFNLPIAAGTGYTMFVRLQGFATKTVAGINVPANATTALGDVVLIPQTILANPDEEPPVAPNPPPGPPPKVPPLPKPKQPTPLKPQPHPVLKPRNLPPVPVPSPRTGMPQPTPTPPVPPVPPPPPPNDPCQQFLMNVVQPDHDRLQQAVNDLQNALPDFLNKLNQTLGASEAQTLQLLEAYFSLFAGSNFFGAQFGAGENGVAAAANLVSGAGSLGSLPGDFQGNNPAAANADFLSAASSLLAGAASLGKVPPNAFGDGVSALTGQPLPGGGVSGLSNATTIAGLLKDPTKQSDLEKAFDALNEAAQRVQLDRQQISQRSQIYKKNLMGYDRCRQNHPGSGSTAGSIPGGGRNGGQASGSARKSSDPNELDGPAGVGTDHFIPAGQTLDYAVGFENDPAKATAAAVNVTVTEKLDANLDWSTFQLGALTFGATTVVVPAGLQAFTTTVTTTNIDGTPLRVNVSAALNQQTGVVTWTFASVDPATDLPPTSTVDGFLPVDDSTGRGQAFVHYTIQPKAGLATGTTLGAQATVVFDTNAPLNTPTVSNTLDAGPPTSSVSPLPAVINSTSFTVAWSGQDDAGGSGIASYTVYASVDGGAFTPFLTNTTQTSAVYSGSFGHRYAFYTVATDNVGHVQATPGAAQASIQLVQPPPPPSQPPATPPPVGPVVLMLIPKRFGKKTKLVAEVFFVGGLPPLDVISPYQKPGYNSIAVAAQGFNADGTFSSLLFTARKGKRHVSSVVPV